MVHGTSVEFTKNLLENGTLPSRYNPTLGNHPINKGYLFFIPRKNSFKSHELYDEIIVDFEGEELVDSVWGYAANNEGKSFLREVLGFWPEDIGPYDWHNGPKDCLLEPLKELGVDISKMRKYGLARLINDLDKRKGVCIALNRKSLSLDIENGCDVPGEEVMIKLPNGLDLSYVHYIHPFGDLEKRSLNYLVEGLSE
tara:strand:+ start:2521 stop:3114 length:594 start_codon:yes stop_codon:yes gene_type:complete